MILNSEIEEIHKLQKEYLGLEKPINNINPLVSVFVTAYQHEEFIATCLDGILKQQTSFQIEIVLGEDKSTDQTREICIDYAKKFPDKIRLFLRDRKHTSIYDQDGNFIKSINSLLVIKACRGKYIAMCEGDDYWTDPLKLQKQVNVLESAKNVVLVSHNAVVYSEHLKKNVKSLQPFPHSGLMPDSWVIRRKSGPIPTASFVFIAEGLRKLPTYLTEAPVSDYYIAIHFASLGKLYHINEEMSVYRLNNGSWTDQKKDSNNYITHHQKHQNSLNLFNQHTKNEYAKDTKVFFQKKTYELFANIIKIGFVRSYIKHRDYLNKSFKNLHKRTYFKLFKIYLKTQIKNLLGKN